MTPAAIRPLVKVTNEGLGKQKEGAAGGEMGRRGREEGGG